MKKVINYIVIEKKDANDLAKEVIRLSSAGWHPIGGVSSRSSNSGLAAIHTQALVQYEQ